jgi:hypothetical protein
MARRQNKPKRRPSSKADLRKQSSPQTEKEKLEAIRTDISADVISYLRSLYMEQGVFADTMRRVLGQGGNDLESFIKQLQKGYSDTNKKLETTEKEDAPILKKMSSEAVIESKLKDELKSDGKNTKMKGKRPQKRK